jgi:GNAT superfamily N-acetyltransferase
MAEWKIIQPDTPEQWSSYFQLRYEVLRKPWNQPIGSERAEDDTSSLHGMIVNTDVIAIAIGRVHEVEKGRAQIRFMAVSPEYQKKGIGGAILKYVESLAKRNFSGLKDIVLQAREEAVPFYRSNGYVIESKSFVLFGCIQHYLMKKKIYSE